MLAKEAFHGPGLVQYRFCVLPPKPSSNRRMNLAGFLINITEVRGLRRVFPLRVATSVEDSGKCRVSRGAAPDLVAEGFSVCARTPLTRRLVREFWIGASVTMGGESDTDDGYSANLSSDTPVL